MSVDRERLGRLVAERRRALGLSISAAARRAGINRATWTAVEEATRDTEVYNYGLIEKVLGWTPGSIDKVLNGRAPSIVDTHVEVSSEQDLDDEAIIKVMQSDRIPEDQKRRIVAILIEDREREKQRRLALADDLIRTWEDTERRSG